MKHFTILFKKELMESWRSFKFLWLPLVFVILGVTEPLTRYYMEDILKSVGNMPEGFEMTFPDFTAQDVLLATLEQYQLIGLIVVISAFIGAISRERQNGTATLLYVRPISSTVIYMSKWLSASFVAICSVTSGFLASLYYTVLLFGGVSAANFIKMVALYNFWIVIVLALTIAMSAAFQTSIAAAITMIAVPIGLLIDAIIGGWWRYTPWKLGKYAASYITEASISKDIAITGCIAAILLICTIAIGIIATKRNRRLTKI